MKYEEFCASLKVDEPASDMPPLLQALWWDAKGNWERAHEIAQDVSSRNGAWVHAYLHRKEGDASNARYWYGQAGKEMCASSEEAEWLNIVESLLSGA